MPYHIGFIVEQALGHVTHGQNLQANVAQGVMAPEYDSSAQTVIMAAAPKYSSASITRCSARVCSWSSVMGSLIICFA